VWAGLRFLRLGCFIFVPVALIDRDSVTNGTKVIKTNLSSVLFNTITIKSVTMFSLLGYCRSIARPSFSVLQPQMDLLGLSVTKGRSGKVVDDYV